MYACAHARVCRCFCLLLYFWHTGAAQFKLVCTIVHALHVQQKIHVVFASAQETDDVPTACGE